MTLKHDSMYLFMAKPLQKIKTNIQQPILKLQILNSLSFAAIPSDVMKHFYTFIFILKSIFTCGEVLTLIGMSYESKKNAQL